MPLSLTSLAGAGPVPVDQRYLFQARQMQALFNPVFFIGTAFAIHGDTYVPLAPVSHGCVRIPMDIAHFFHTLVKVPGEPVIIRR